MKRASRSKKIKKINKMSKPAATLIYPKELVKSPISPPGVRLEENIYVSMRDRIKIAVDIYRPENEGRYPALLSLAPYIKDIQQQPPHWSHSIESGATGFYVPRGYVHVIAQGRGSGLSQGQWNFFDEKERRDGYDLVEWIAKQPWCNGNVGMIGDSYFSWSQYSVAQQQPPHLKCLCQCDATIDLYRDVFYQGGIFNSPQFVEYWIPNSMNMIVWPGFVEGKVPPINLGFEVASHPYDGPFYWDRSAWPKLDKIKVPVMSIVPQRGILHVRGQLDAFPKIKSPKKLIVAPQSGFWSHLRYLTNKALNQQMLRWFDYWLKDIDTGIMNDPEVAIFDMATRKWRYENEYPLKRTQWTKFYLRSNPAGLATEPPYGLLTIEPPGDEKPDSYKLPDSVAQLAAGKPVLAYSTPSLEKDFRLWGPVSITFYASSTALDTAWFVKLMDINPDGSFTFITRGILKASFRKVDRARSKPGQPFHPFMKQELLEPNKIYEFQIEIWPVFHTFKTGHKIQVQIASDDLQYNAVLRSIDVQLQPKPVKNTIYHDSAHPSHLFLPIIPDSPEIKPVEPPVSEIDWPFVPAFWMPDTSGWPLLIEKE